MKVYTSQLKGIDLPSAVQRQIEALCGHRSTVGVAAPVPEHAIVEQCIRRVQYPIEAGKPDEFVADYEIVDDAEYT